MPIGWSSVPSSEKVLMKLSQVVNRSPQKMRISSSELEARAISKFLDDPGSRPIGGRGWRDAMAAKIDFITSYWMLERRECFNSQRSFSWSS